MSRAKFLHQLTCDTVVKVCDQLSAVVAEAYIAGDHEMVNSVVPAIASLWQLRWELNVTGGTWREQARTPFLVRPTCTKDGCSRERRNEGAVERATEQGNPAA
jgi:hypothetical protein